MKKKLEFSIRIEASRPHVWHAMLDDPTYRVWTQPFGAGSYYQGEWQKGQKIRFLGPGGDGGMVAEIAELVAHEYISIRHLGFVVGGVDDTDSDAVRAWAPAYENYRLLDVAGATELRVEVETFSPELDEFMRAAWPKALAALQELCEPGTDAPA